MNINISYEEEFEQLLNELRVKYGDKVFEADGIGSQLDICKFSKEFFANKAVVADKSVDSNANVDDATMVSYTVEMPKSYFRLNSLYLLWRYSRRLYDKETAAELVESQICGDYYINDFHGFSMPYCYNFSTYDVMTKGLPFVRKITSKPPKHLRSFIGQMIHFSVYASNSVLGAVGLADMLIVTSYYVKRMLNDERLKEDYVWEEVKQELQSFIFSCNQPFRGGIQSGFYNISLFDDVFLNKLCSEYLFPDGSTPDIELVKKLQILFMDLINETLRETPLTFPVTTACFAIDENKDILSDEFVKTVAKKNKEFAFMNIYHGDKATLSSCCRLRSNTKNEYFNQFGAGSSKIGSLGVVTINLPRIAIKSKKNMVAFLQELRHLTGCVAKINNVKRHIIKSRIEQGKLPLYTFGFMDLNTQYSTVGLCGINEACELMGLDILTEEGQAFVRLLCDAVNKVNDEFAKKYKAPHNCEQTPSENSAIKMAAKDKILGYISKYELYSNQFIPLTTKANMLDRIRLQGMFDGYMSGGAICHLNVETQIEDEARIEEMIRMCAKMGVVYWAINYNLQRCVDSHMSVGKSEVCSVCGEPIEENYTRVVGFLTCTKNWHIVRREKDYPNRQFYPEDDVHEYSGDTIQPTEQGT